MESEYGSSLQAHEDKGLCNQIDKIILKSCF